MLSLPSVYGVAQARTELARMLEEVNKGYSFIIKGPKGREALLTSATAVRAFQEAYIDLVGEVETSKILQDDDAMRALSQVNKTGEEEKRYTLSEVESLVGEVEDVGGEEP